MNGEPATLTGANKGIRVREAVVSQYRPNIVYETYPNVLPFLYSSNPAMI